MNNPASLVSNAAVKSAYKNSQSLIGDKGAADIQQENNETFANMVRGASQNAVETLRTGEAMAQAGLRGEADTQQVVEAVLAMESTVKVATSVRDRLVSAYQEILRMPI